MDASEIIVTAEIVLGPEDRIYREMEFCDDGPDKCVEEGVEFADGTRRKARITRRLAKIAA